MTSLTHPIRLLIAAALAATMLAPAEEERPHWSFQALTKPPEPAISNQDWGHNPIDRFVLAPL